MITIDKKENCTGCSACANVCPKSCIRIVPDEEGFGYPVVDHQLCIECDLCVKTCPIINYCNELSPQRIVGLRNKDDEELLRSASGGVFPALAEYVVNAGGLVAGAVWNKDFSVSHQMCDNIKDAQAFRGSKYQQSHIGQIYREIKKCLQANRLVLFTGTPCQVAGLKHFLRKPYDNLFTCDLICHGVPSPKVFQSYVAHIEQKYNRSIIDINMRDKTFGWDNSGVRVKFSDGTSIFRNKDTNLFNAMYSVHYATRPSCHHCVYANFHREGDLTIGDFWTVKTWQPEFFYPKGVSVAIVNTPKGRILLEAIEKNFYVVESDEEEILQNNLYQSAPPSSARARFFQVYLQNGYERAIRQFLDYGRMNQIKGFFRKVCRKFHLPEPGIIKSTIIK